jgi:hypothetical protein
MRCSSEKRRPGELNDENAGGDKTGYDYDEDVPGGKGC